MYIDDILLSSTIESDLIDQVPDCLEKVGLQARKDKCQSFVNYVGHRIEAES